jgi:hypothetical protein
MLFGNDDPAKNSPRHITIRLGETVRDLIARNGLAVGPYDGGHDFTVDVDKIADVSPVIFGDHWLSLTLDDGPYGFALPPGRTLFISQMAGRITDFTFTPFAQPQPLAQIADTTAEFVRHLEALGWRDARPAKIPRSPDDLDVLTKSLIVFQGKTPDGQTVDVTIKDLGMIPKSESYILKLAPAPRREPSQTYILVVGVYADTHNLSYADRIYPRRIFVNGDKDARLRLRAWVDDPDWSPEAAGMVAATAEQRAQPDASAWVMPERSPAR